TDSIRVDVRIRQRDGALVDVGQHHAASFREASGDDPDDAITASQIQDRLARSYFEGRQEELGPAVESAARKDAGIGLERKRRAAPLHANPPGRWGDRRWPFEVLLTLAPP